MKTSVVVALTVEAQPLIHYFGLKQSKENHPFAIWEGDAMRLIISGIGKVAAAGATTYLYGRYGNAPFFNFGVAGHPLLSIGKAAIVSSIFDPSMQKAFYPILLASPPCDLAPLITVDSPETSYSEETLYDMEASGFFLASSRCVTLEQISVFKVVSDNLSHKPELVTKEHVRQCVKGALSIFERWIQSFPSFQKEIVPIPEAFSKWRFTVSEKEKLQRLINRFHALGIDLPSTNAKTKKEVFLSLESALLPKG